MTLMNLPQINESVVSFLSGPLVLNVIGGILSGFAVLVLGWLWAICHRKYSRRKFKRVFGTNVEDTGYTLIYGALELADRSSAHPYLKPRGNPSYRFSISFPVSISEVRASNYLAGTIGQIMGYTPGIRSDLELHDKLDLDFVAFGGPRSNFKTLDCQMNDKNRLVVFDQDRFTNRANGENVVSFEPGFDYGMILKIRPQQFPNRVWIVCAGRDEWGTSGAAWFLANKWNEIENRAGDRPFAIIVRVRPGQDESAQIVLHRT